MNVQRVLIAPTVDRSRGTHDQDRPIGQPYRYGYAPTWAVLALARADRAHGYSGTEADLAKNR